MAEGYLGYLEGLGGPEIAGKGAILGCYGGCSGSGFSARRYYYVFRTGRRG